VPGCEVAAALGPLHQREPTDVKIMKPAAFLLAGEVYVSLSPLPRPVILCSVEPGTAEPVRHRQLFGVPDPEAALLG